MQLPKGLPPQKPGPQVCPAQPSAKPERKQDPSFPRASLRPRQPAALPAAVGCVMAVFNPWPHRMIELPVLSPEGGGGRGRVTYQLPDQSFSASPQPGISLSHPSLGPAPGQGAEVSSGLLGSRLVSLVWGRRCSTPGKEKEAGGAAGFTVLFSGRATLSPRLPALSLVRRQQSGDGCYSTGVSVPGRVCGSESWAAS